MPARRTTPTRIALATRVALTALLLGLTFTSGASAQSARLSAVRAPYAGQLVVPLNKSQVLKLDVPYKEVSVGTPEIAEVVPVSQNTIYVLGRKLGSTSLIFGGDGGRVLAIADLVVGYDTDSLKQKLYEVAPDEPIEVRTANDALVLSGRVSSSDKLQRIVAMAEQYAPKKVSNLLNVGGSQQVMLQVRFAEVDREFLKALGISEAFINGGTTAFRLLSGVGLTNAFAGLGSANGLLGAATTPFANLTFHQGDFDANIQILERKGVITLLAEPNLTALSGDTASFLAGGEFPIPVAQNGNGILGTTITVEFKPFGVSLNFTPTVIDKDIINLVLKSEVSDIDRTLSVFSALPGQVAIPGLRVRRTETTVEVRDGQAFMISGLLQHNFQDAIEQFPWIGNVPVLGALFRSPEYRQRRTELVVFITPRLVQPVLAGGLKSPTDGFLVPSEAALFLNGQVEARPGQGEPSCRRCRSARRSPTPAASTAPAATSSNSGDEPMPPRLKIVFAAAGLSLALAACDSPPFMQDFNKSFGEAINYNIAVQTVDPTPDDAIYAPTFDGERTDLMMQRYRADKMKQPGPLRTSGIGSTSGGYGNGGGEMGGAGQ